MNSIKMIAVVLVAFASFGCQSKRDNSSANKRPEMILCPNPNLVEMTREVCKDPRVASHCELECTVTTESVVIKNDSPYLVAICDDSNHCTHMLVPNGELIIYAEKMPEFKFYSTPHN